MSKEIDQLEIKKGKPVEYVRNHISTYAGDYIPEDELGILYDPISSVGGIKKIESRIEAIEKIIDEVITNSIDNAKRPQNPKQTYIKVNYELNPKHKNYGVLEVENDGRGIPLSMMDDKKWSIEAAFTTKETGSNFGKGKEGAGTFGVGVKVTTFTSTFLQIENHDFKSKKIYNQEYKVDKKNELIISKPKITSNKGMKKGLVRIKFRPDYEWFLSLSKTKITNTRLKKVIDSVGLFIGNKLAEAGFFLPKNIQIEYNGVEIKIKSFLDYVNFLIPKGIKNVKSRFTPLTYKGKEMPKWEIITTKSLSSNINMIAYVNGIPIRKGKHVKLIIDSLVEVIRKKKRDTSLQPSVIKRKVSIFANCYTIDPKFNSLLKRELSTNTENINFPPKREIKKYFERVYTSLGLSSLFDEKELSQAEDVKALEEGVKKVKIGGMLKTKYHASPASRNVPNLERILMIVEGLSASAMPETGRNSLGPKEGKKYGIFLLRGKMINPRKKDNKFANTFKGKKNQKSLENNVIANLIFALGIQDLIGRKKKLNFAEVRKKLNYGKIIIMTDQDVDGFHIRGLLINVLNYISKTLFGYMENSETIRKKIFGDANWNYINILSTPLVRIRGKNFSKIFLTTQSFEEYKKKNTKKIKTMQIKYYKGLGTSTKTETKEVFENLETFLRPVVFTKNSEKELAKAFDDDTDIRKDWLRQYDKDKILDVVKNKTIKIKDFINGELIHFSQYSNLRAFPSMYDGFKPSQRKIIYVIRKEFARKTIDELMKISEKNQIKVDNLAASVSKAGIYHHGITSLAGAIMLMSRDLVGTNIWPLFPIGTIFSNRRQTEPTSQPRYVSVQVNPLINIIYPPIDDQFLTFTEKDDGGMGEPEFYVPIIPMVLAYGIVGMGTGWSTNIPTYDIFGLIKLVRKNLTRIKKIENKKRVKKTENPIMEIDDATIEKDFEEVNVWIEGFTGKILKRTINGRVSFLICANYSYDETSGKLIIQDPPPYDGSVNFVGETRYIDAPDVVARPSYIFEKQMETVVGTIEGFAVKGTVKKYVETGIGNKKTRINMRKRVAIINQDGYGEEKIKMLKKLKLLYEVKPNNMHTIDQDFTVYRIDKFAKFFKQWFGLRFRIYQERLDKFISDKEYALMIAQNKVRFIKDVNAKKIKLGKITLAGVKKYLDSNKFDKNKEGSYNYLYDIPIRHQTMDEIKKLEELIKKLLRELEILKNSTISEMWNRELDEAIKIINKLFEKRRKDAIALVLQK